MRQPAAGVTLLEAVLAATLMALALAVAYPALDRGLEGVRLRALADEAATLLLEAQREANRSHEPVLVRIAVEPGAIRAVSADGGWRRELSLPRSVRFAAPSEPASLVLHPGGVLPGVDIGLRGRGPAGAGFRVDPLDGALRSRRAGE